MEKTVAIENELKKIESGKFQRLCDEILLEHGYQNHFAQGSQSGTFKTVLGTPDSFFINKSGKFCFVEYTVQIDNIYKKINDDLEKCFSLIDSNHALMEVEEILFFFISDKLKIEQIAELLDICKKRSIILKLFNINQIAEIIETECPYIAADYLNISIDSNQILTYNRFITESTHNKFTAPLDFSLLGRETEITKLLNNLNESDMVIIHGQSGIGKTKLALEVAKLYAEKNLYELFCIKNKNLDITGDLSFYFCKPGKYLFFIDDANTWNEKLNYFLNYLNNDLYEIKIIITIRDYALSSILSPTKIYSPSLFALQQVSRETVESFLKNNLGIKNPDYIEKIQSISKGNMRLAFMAGKIAIKKNSLCSLLNTTDLYSNYYSLYIQESCIFNKRNYLEVLGIISILKYIDTSRIESYKIFLSIINIEETDLLKIIKDLEILEIINVKHNIVTLSDECFSNYLLYLFFIEKKIISISSFIKINFPSYNQEIVDFLNILYSLFFSEEMDRYIKNEIDSIWNNFKLSTCYYDFLKTFHAFNADETFLYIKNEISKIPENHSFPLISIHTEKVNIITNPIVELVACFSQDQNSELAIELLFLLGKKNYNLLPEILFSLKRDWSINKNSSKEDYKTINIIVDNLLMNINDEAICNLFMELAKHYISLYFTPTETSGKRSISFYTIPVLALPGAKSYREKIWNMLIQFSKENKFTQHILELLRNYSSGWDDSIDVQLLKFDKAYIQKLITSLTTEDIIAKYQISEALNKKYNHFNLTEKILIKSDDKLDVKVHKCFCFDEYRHDMAYEEIEKQIEVEINDLLKNEHYSVQEIVTSLEHIAASEPNDQWNMSHGINYFIQQLTAKESLDFLETYFKTNILEITPNILIKKLFVYFSFDQIYSFLSKQKRFDTNYWQYTCFSSLPKEKINKNTINIFLKFLTNKNDRNLQKSSFRDLSFISYYVPYDNKIFHKVSKKIIKKKSYNPFFVHVYFNLLFNPYTDNSPERVLEFYKGYTPILKKIYFLELTYDSCLDNNHLYIKEFIKSDVSWIKSYIEFIKEKISHNQNIYPDISFLWEYDNFIESFTQLFMFILNENKHKRLLPFYQFKDLFISKQNNNLVVENNIFWFKRMIDENFNDEKAIRLLFSIISELPADRKFPLYYYFVHKNNNINLFKTLPIFSSVASWTGSAVPLYEEKIRKLEQLNSFFKDDINLLPHRNYINEIIQGYQEYITTIRKDEYEEELLLR